MEKEIGSVLEFDREEYYMPQQLEKVFLLPFMKEKEKYHTFFYQNGRNAIEKLLNVLKREQKIEKIALPEFVCDVVKEAISRAGVELLEYGIHPDCSMDLQEVEDIVNKGVSCIYIVHYWGRELNREELQVIARWKEQGIVIVEDITLSMFSKGENSFGFGDYVLGSLRKWLPIPDGAFISTRNLELDLSAENPDTSQYTYFYTITQLLKRQYIQTGCSNKKLKEVYMDYYHKSTEANFSDFTICDMSEVSKYYLQNYNQDKLIARRIENYDYLYSRLKELDVFTFPVVRGKACVPFGFFMLCSQRDSLLSYLIEHDIYCNVHWRLHKESLRNVSQRFQEEAITIPIDQRYGIEEMQYIYETISEWYNNWKEERGQES